MLGCGQGQSGICGKRLVGHSLTKYYHHDDFIDIPDTAGEVGGPGLCAILIAFLSLLLVLATLPFSLYMCVKVGP